MEIKIYKAAFTGNLKVYKELINDYLKYNYGPSIIGYCNKGIYKNFEFAKYCYENGMYDSDDDILITAYLTHGEYNEKFTISNTIYEYINKISKDKLLNLLKYNELSELCVYLAILNEYEDVYSKIKNPVLNKYSRDLVSQLNMSSIVKGIPFEPVIFPWRPVKYKRYVEKDSIEKDVLLDIVEGCEPDDTILTEEARNLQNKVDLNNVISKFICIDLELSYELLSEYQPFLYFKGVFFDIDDFDEENYKCFAIYTRYLAGTKLSLKQVDELKYLEWNWVLAARRVCATRIMDQLKIIYDKTGLCYKIMDFEQGKYVKERMYLDDSEFDYSKMRFHL